jgi:hypothetical protein
MSTCHKMPYSIHYAVTAMLRHYITVCGNAEIQDIPYLYFIDTEVSIRT